MFLIVTTAFASIAIPSSDVVDRLSIILTMFLTAVAFQFVLSERLPSKPYMTLTDRYIIGAFSLLFVQALLAVVNTGPGQSDTPMIKQAAEYDIVGELVVLTVWVSMHLFLALLQICEWTCGPKSTPWLRKPWQEVIAQNANAKVMKAKAAGPSDPRFEHFAANVAADDSSTRCCCCCCRRHRCLKN